MDLIAFLLLVGTTVAVPLGLVLLRKRALGDRERAWLGVAQKAHPVAALSLIGSFYFLPGHPAAALALPWLLFSGLLAVIGCIRLLNGGWRFPGPISYTAALGYIPIGAAWLFASRLGINPGGFGEPIVLLTGVHFHFSGFAASILAGEVTRHAPQYPGAGRWVVLGALTATPLIAMGFVFSMPLKVIGILFFTSTLATLAWLQYVSARRLEPGGSRKLLIISSASILTGMVLASIYGLTDAFGWPWLSIPQMARFHGTLNALGFVLCGLIGWFLIRKKEAAS